MKLILLVIIEEGEIGTCHYFLVDTVGHYTSTSQKQLKVSFGGHCCINVANGSLRGFAKNVLPSPCHERESKASESSFQVLRPNVENFCTK